MAQRRQPTTWVALTRVDGGAPMVVLVSGLGERADELRERAVTYIGQHVVANGTGNEWRMHQALGQEMLRNLVIVSRADASRRYRSTWRAWLAAHAA